ncbi:DNA-invertase [Klebsiella michiganensis]
MLIGYARVSTGDQNLDLQKNALVRAECELIFEDTASGNSVDAARIKESYSPSSTW